MYGLDNAVLRPIVQLTDKRFGDFIFIHKDNKTILTRLGNPCGVTYHCKKSMKEAKAE
jgi:hypothetical protein